MNFVEGMRISERKIIPNKKGILTLRPFLNSTIRDENLRLRPEGL
jgi:hypothetical protein